MQALEVIKVITGVGEILDGRLFFFDTLNFETRIFNFKRNRTNPLNGDHPTLHHLGDYEQFCALKTEDRKVKEISAKVFSHWKEMGEDFQLIDVREPVEYEAVNMGGELIPLADILSHAKTISRNRKVVVHCKLGGRSAVAIRQLEDNFGFQNLYNLKGGIMAYLQEAQTLKANHL